MLGQFLCTAERPTHTCIYTFLFQYYLSSYECYCKRYLKNLFLLSASYMIFLLAYLFFVFFFLRATPSAYGGSQARDVIRAVAAGLCHSHRNEGSLTHWVRPGIKPVSSWMLVRFVSGEPQWEALLVYLVCCFSNIFSLMIYVINFLIKLLIFVMNKLILLVYPEKNHSHLWIIIFAPYFWFLFLSLISIVEVLWSAAPE